MSNWFEMICVYARTVATKMVQFFSSWDRAELPFPFNYMSFAVFTIAYIDSPITLVHVALKNNAILCVNGFHVLVFECIL